VLRCVIADAARLVCDWRCWGSSRATSLTALETRTVGARDGEAGRQSEAQSIAPLCRLALVTSHRQRVHAGHVCGREFIVVAHIERPSNGWRWSWWLCGRWRTQHSSNRAGLVRQLGRHLGFGEPSPFAVEQLAFVQLCSLARFGGYAERQHAAEQSGECRRQRLKRVGWRHAGRGHTPPPRPKRPCRLIFLSCVFESGWGRRLNAPQHALCTPEDALSSRLQRLAIQATHKHLLLDRSMSARQYLSKSPRRVERQHASWPRTHPTPRQQQQQQQQQRRRSRSCVKRLRLCSCLSLRFCKRDTHALLFMVNSLRGQAGSYTCM
jgi:hypothetical protein